MKHRFWRTRLMALWIFGTPVAIIEGLVSYNGHTVVWNLMRMLDATAYTIDCYHRELENLPREWTKKRK